MKKPIAFTEWRGAARYRCPYCEFDNGDEVSVAEHIKWRHRDVMPKTPPPVVEAAPKRKASTDLVEPSPLAKAFIALETGE